MNNVDLVIGNDIYTPGKIGDMKELEDELLSYISHFLLSISMGLLRLSIKG